MQIRLRFFVSNILQDVHSFDHSFHSDQTGHGPKTQRRLSLNVSVGEHIELRHFRFRC